MTSRTPPLPALRSFAALVRLGSIGAEIEQDLVQLRSIAQHSRTTRFHFHLDLDVGRMEGMRVKVSTQLLSLESSPPSSSRGAGHRGDDVLLCDWHAELVPPCRGVYQ